MEDLSKALAACKQQVSYYKSIASDQRDQIDRTVDEGTLLTESMMRERDAAAKLKQQRKDFQQQKRQWEASHMSPRIAKIHSSEGAFSTANFTDIDQQYSESEIGSGSPQLVLRSLSRNKPDLVIETKPPSKGNTYPPRSALRSGSPQVGYKRQSMSPYNKSSPSSTSRVSSIGVGIPKSLQHLESTSASRGSTPKKGLGTQQSPSKSPSSSKQSSRNSSPKSSARIPKTYQDKKDDQANENKYLTQGMLSRPYSTYEVVSPKHKVKPISYITDSLLNASSSRPSVEEKPMRSPNARAAVANATKSPKARNPRAETFGLTAAEIDEEQRSQASKRENSPTENSEYDSDFTFSSTMELLQGNASAYEVRNKSSSENEEEMSKIYRTIADKAIAGGFAKHENNKKVDPKLEDLLNQSAIVSDRFASNNIAVMDTINLDQSVFNTTNDDVLNSTKLRGVDNSIASVSSARSRQSSMKQAAAVGALVANSVVEKFNRLAIDYNKLVILYAQEIKECENMRMDFKGEIYAHVSKVNEMEERLHTISNENSHLLRQISELKEKSNYEDNLLTDAKASEKAENERFVNKLSKELDRLQRDLEEAVGTIEFQGERITRSQVVEISIGQVGHEKTNGLSNLCLIYRPLILFTYRLETISW